MRVFVLLGVCAMLSTAVNAQPASPIAIFVGPQTRDGFVDIDSGVADSIKDIQTILKKSPQFILAANAGAATMTLTIIGRGVPGSAGATGITVPGATFGGGTIAGVAQPTYTTPGVTTLVSLDKHAITAVLQVGSYSRQIVSIDESGSGWRVAADNVVKDLLVWLTANRAALPTPTARN